MAGTPEEDLLAWLEREEESLGFAAVESGLQDIDRARDLFYDELGYDLTDDQFTGLTAASYLRYEELPAVGVAYRRFERPWGYQATFRYEPTGQFISSEAAFGLVGMIR